MSKLTSGILVAAVMLIVISVIVGSAFVARGSGVVLLVALAYAYVVNKREVERNQS